MKNSAWKTKTRPLPRVRNVPVVGTLGPLCFSKSAFLGVLTIMVARRSAITAYGVATWWLCLSTDLLPSRPLLPDVTRSDLGLDGKVCGRDKDAHATVS
jgi:hypothetical protein